MAGLMSRPDDRPLRRLPQLMPRKATLERCVFCPKLCRSACPVSNVDTRETVTPWGKMSMAYFAANESVALAETFAKPAWACTGCFGCREHCDHKNDVTGTLFEARSALVENGLGPEGARRTIERFVASPPALGNIARDPAVSSHVSSASKTALLVGCEYARTAPDRAREAIRATAKLVGSPVVPIDVCCGAPLLYAGDKKRFAEQAEALTQALKHVDRLVVADAGCAAAIRVHHASSGNAMPVPVEHFTELAASKLGLLEPLASGPGAQGVRWHDPCQLGRGLGVYDAPRAILSRVFGRAPGEFERKRNDARCSGAGGLLPLTMPDVARGMAKQRVDDHARSGGGTIVTACASSARSFAKAGADVLDIVTIVDRALSG